MQIIHSTILYLRMRDQNSYLLSSILHSFNIITKREERKQITCQKINHFLAQFSTLLHNYNVYRKEKWAFGYCLYSQGSYSTKPYIFTYLNGLILSDSWNIGKNLFIWMPAKNKKDQRRKGPFLASQYYVLWTDFQTRLSLWKISTGEIKAHNVCNQK